MFDKLKKAFGGAEEAPKAEKKVEAAPAKEEVKAEAPAETKAASAKPRIGYIHLSGCTGDAMSLTENYDILSTVLTDMVDIVYGQTLVDKWIHGTFAEEMPEMDVCLIEGSVCLQDEHSVHELLEAREKSGLIVAFGSCALTGCFTTYARGGQQAQPKHEAFLPISSLVKVDAALPGGCGCDVLTNVVRQGLCSGCGTCGLACPTRAMGYSEGRPSCDRDRCIKCGTCYVMCPRSWLPEGRIKKETGL